MAKKSERQSRCLGKRESTKDNDDEDGKTSAALKLVKFRAATVMRVVVKNESPRAQNIQTMRKAPQSCSCPVKAVARGIARLEQVGSDLQVSGTPARAEPLVGLQGVERSARAETIGLEGGEVSKNRRHTGKHQKLTATRHHIDIECTAQNDIHNKTRLPSRTQTTPRMHVQNHDIAPPPQLTTTRREERTRRPHRKQSMSAMRECTTAFTRSRRKCGLESCREEA